MLHTLTKVFDDRDSVNFKSLVQRNNRKQVASKFYTFLVLKKLCAVELYQSKSFSDIIVRKGPAFDRLVE